MLDENMILADITTILSDSENVYFCTRLLSLVINIFIICRIVKKYHGDDV